MLTPQLQNRIIETLDELVTAHTEAALCADNLRSLFTPCIPGGGSGIPRVNNSTLSVEWEGKVCVLKNSLTFRLMETLCRRPGHVYTLDQLLHVVWAGDSKSPDTIRSTIRHLKNKLKKADMSDLANAVRTRGHGYCFAPR